MSKKKRIILLKGPEKSGKTTTAGTISKHFGTGPLIDCYGLDGDANGFESLEMWGSSIESTDLFVADSQKDRLAMLDETEKMLNKNPSINKLLISGFSTIGWDLEGEFKAKYPGDKFGLYGELITEFRKIFRRLRKMQHIEEIVIECHTKAESTESAKDTLKKEAAGMEKKRQILLDVPGRTAGWLERQASILLPCFKDKEGPKLYPNGYPTPVNPTCRGGHKYRDALNDVEEPNLLAIIQKIEAYKASLKGKQV